MKTIMIIDGAQNCAYDCFLSSEALFDFLFPGEGQDIEFIEDVQSRSPPLSLKVKEEFDAMWERPVRKNKVEGIDGILFYELENKKPYYPNKMDSDLDYYSRGLRGPDVFKPDKPY
jgi:hypothetical protein